MRPSTRKSLILSLPLLIGALMAAGALTSCGGPERVSSTPAMVSYNVTGSNLAQANERAADYCRSQMVPPRLVSVQNGVATYQCGSPPATVPPAPAYPPQTSPISPAPVQ
jgi:hypothetical protein